MGWWGDEERPPKNVDIKTGGVWESTDEDDQGQDAVQVVVDAARDGCPLMLLSILLPPLVTLIMLLHG